MTKLTKVVRTNDSKLPCQACDEATGKRRWASSIFVSADTLTRHPRKALPWALDHNRSAENSVTFGKYGIEFHI